MKALPLDPDNLRLVLAVAQAGSLSKVALQEHTSQPQISKAIAQVEAQCGAKIFRRTGRGMTLTDFGKAIVPRMENWLLAGYTLAEDIRGLSGSAIGHVRLAIPPVLSSPMMSMLFLRLRETHPGVRISFLEGYFEQIRAWLDSGQVDLGVTLRYEGQPHPGALHLVDFPVYLCSGPNDRITRVPSIPLTALDGLPLVVHAESGMFYQMLERLCQERAVTLYPALEANSLEIQKDIASSGVAYALLGQNAIARDVHRGRLQASLLVHPSVTQHLEIEFPKNGPIGLPARETARLLGEIIREAAAKGILHGRV